MWLLWIFQTPPNSSHHFLKHSGNIAKADLFCLMWNVKQKMWELDHKEGGVLKNWCFWIVVLEKALESPWTARRSNQFILNEISPGCSLEGLMLKLKLQYFGHLMWRPDSLEKTLMMGKMRAGGEGDDRGWDGWMASLTQWTWLWVDPRSWWWRGRPDVLQFMGSQNLDMTELLNWLISKNTDCISEGS